MKIIRFLSFIIIFSSLSYADTAEELNISQDEMTSIEDRIKSLSPEELTERYAFLTSEIEALNKEQSETQDPSRKKLISAQIALAKAEQHTIEHALERDNNLILLLPLLALADSGGGSGSSDTGPIITIAGDNPATVELGSTYTDAGATADGGETVTVSGTVNTSIVGSYTITYTATDVDGNTTTATRIVNVVDTTAPVVTVIGDNPATVELGSAYTDAGATATDLSGTVAVVTTGSVDINSVGTYILTYSATDY